MRFWVLGLGSGVECLELRAWGLGFMVADLGYRVQGSRFRVKDLWSGV